MAYHCPFCAAVSHHPEDERRQYCGRCRQWGFDHPGRPRWHLRTAGAVSLQSYRSFLQAYLAAVPLLRDGHELEAIDETSLAEHRPGIPLGRHEREREV